MVRTFRAALCASVLLPLSVAPVLAQDVLRVGLAANITSLDPQFHVVGSNSALARNVFDGLVNQDDRQQVVAGLAESWRPVDDTTWEFKLRQGLRFHDGSPAEAEDIAASLRRVPTVRNSPSSFLPYVKPIAAVDVVDAHTIRIRTTAPYPLLPNALTRIAIIPRSLEKAETADFNSGKAMIGTGPYRFHSYTNGDRLELEAAEPAQGAWKQVAFRFIPNNAGRVAALLSNDVDVIEGVPTPDIGKLRKDGRVRLSSIASNRVMYLHLDHEREQSPFVRGRNGEAIPNALRDPRVRQALSLALDRKAIVARVMDGEGTPAGQLVPEGYFGYVPGLQAPAFDLPGAKKLLAEAGLPSGFQLTLHATNDRYPNDEKVAQVLAQLWTRAGIQTKVEAQPGNVFFARASNREYSLIMGGAAAETGEASSVMRPLLATFNPDKGDGSGNRGRYSNPEFDRLLTEALATVDDTKREALLRQATELAMKENAVIPIFFLANSWASRPGFNYRPRTDGWTLAINATR
jgi:peptide/nickel transport system substrate-binding protein